MLICLRQFPDLDLGRNVVAYENISSISEGSEFLQMNNKPNVSHSGTTGLEFALSKYNKLFYLCYGK